MSLPSFKGGPLSRAAPGGSRTRLTTKFFNDSSLFKALTFSLSPSVYLAVSAVKTALSGCRFLSQESEGRLLQRQAVRSDFNASGF